MNANSKPRPRNADRSQAEEEARRLSRAVASGDRTGAAEALTTLAQTLEGLRTRKLAAAPDHQNDVPRESFDPARGLKPARNPAFAAAQAAGVSRRAYGKVWPRAIIGIAVAGAAAWWFTAHRPEPHPEPVAATAQNNVPQSGAVLANNTSGREAAEADLLESEVMALAGQMSAPEMHATQVAPAAPVVAEKAPAPPPPGPKALAAPPDALATATPATDFSAVASLITQWRNEQAQLLSAEKKLAAGRTAEARHLIAAVQTQIVLQPVTPDEPQPAPGNNATAAQLGRTLQLLDAGQEELALRTLHDAIQHLRSLFPAVGTPEAGAG